MQAFALRLQTGRVLMMSMQLPTPEQDCPIGQQNAFQTLACLLSLPVNQLLNFRCPFSLLLLSRLLYLMSR